MGALCPYSSCPHLDQACIAQAYQPWQKKTHAQSTSCKRYMNCNIVIYTCMPTKKKKRKKKKNSKHVVTEILINSLGSRHSHNTWKETVPSLLASKSTAWRYRPTRNINSDYLLSLVLNLLSPSQTQAMQQIATLLCTRCTISATLLK